MKQILSLTAAMLFAFTAFAQDGYKVGDYAEDFSLKNTDGKMVSMADFPDAKGFIVIFTCNHCPYSKLYEDRIIALDKKFKKKGYPVIAINPNDPEIEPDDSYEKMIIRAEEKGFTFPYLFDEGQKVFPKYGATRTPHVFLLNKEDDKLKVAYIGAIDDNAKKPKEVKNAYLANAVRAVMKGDTPDPTVTKAIGCSIKVSK